MMVEIVLCEESEIPTLGKGKSFIVDIPPALKGKMEPVYNVDAGKTRVALFNTPHGLRAFLDACPHQGVPLSDGKMTNGVVTCNWHFWQFDLRDGRCLLSDAANLCLYKTRIDSGKVFIELKGKREE